MKTFFRGPQNERVENPSEGLLSTILKKDDAYWKAGSGAASIEIEGNDDLLLFFNEESFGFFIMYHPDYLAPVVGDIDNIVTIHHSIGGELMPTPSCCYASMEQALTILTHYLASGELYNKYEWCDIYELNFDHGY